MSPPRTPHRPPPPERRRPPSIRWNSWNLLLLVPLISLLTPLYNRVNPRLFGMPFFYWFQLFCIFIGVAVTSLVYTMTRGDYVITDRPDRLNVDSLDEGAGR
jgi:hypothetical protein